VLEAGGAELFRDSGLMAPGSCASNNVAEYTALARALEWVESRPDLKGKAILVLGDSRLVVCHARALWGWKKNRNKQRVAWQPHKGSPHLLPLLEQVMAALGRLRPLAQPFHSFSRESVNDLPITWVAGETNPADAVSRLPLDEAGIRPRQFRKKA
jgi:hypothetical protein